MADDSSAARAGERIGPYRLLHEIGRGGMGSVWLAERADGAFDRQVALKLPHLTWASGLAQRMARERRIGAMLEHPAIARMYDAGVDDQGRPYIAMEHIEGQPIDAFVAARGRDVGATLKLMLPVIRAVAYAHGRLVIHRDLKPSNVLVSSDARVHLLDFGIATLVQDGPDDAAADRLTFTQGLALTPAYASPEQLRGEPVTVQSDVYGLGVMLYELLSGSLPHARRRAGLAALQDRPEADDPEPVSRRTRQPERARRLRGDVDAIVGKALKSELAERYRSADALADDIERHLRGDPVLAQPDRALYRLKKAIGRHRLAVGATTAVCLALFAGISLALVHSQRAARAAERQQLVVDYVTEVFRLNPGHASTANPTATPTANPTANPLIGDALLRHSAQLVAQKFPQDPGLQARLYGVIAELFQEMGASDEAAGYAQRQLELLQASGADNGQLFDAELTWSRTLEGSGRQGPAIAAARRALALAGSDEGRQAGGLAWLVRILPSGHDRAEHERLLDRLDALAKRMGKPSTDVAWGAFTRAMLMAFDNRLAEARPLMEHAIELARTAEGPDSLTVAEMQRDLGWQLMQNNDGAAARIQLQAGHDTYLRHGGVSAVKGALVHATDWAWLLISRGVQYAEARAAVEEAQAATARFAAVPDRLRIRLAVERGIVATLWGDLDEAWRWLPENAERLLASTDSAATRMQVAQVATSVFIARGEHAGADRWIDEIFRARQKMMGGADRFAVWDPIVRAINLSMSGRPAAALAILDPMTVPATLPAGMPASVSTSDELRVARARVLADSGRHEAAWALVGVPPLPEVDDEGLGIVSSKPLRAELLCRRGSSAEGRALFDAEIALALKDRFEHHPAVAWLRAKAGLCALAAGDRAAAQALARQARATFTKRPVASGYYQAPLLQLEAALGRQATVRR